MANHKFIEDWGRRMEEILVLVGSLKIEESSLEERDQKEGRGGEGTSKVRKTKQAIEASFQNQRNPQPELATKEMLSSNKKPQPSLLERASIKSLEEEDHKEGQGFYQGNDQIWLPKQKKTAATNISRQD